MTDDARLAIEGLRRALEVAPNDLALRRLLGERHLAAGDAAEAIEAYKAALKLAPADAALKLELANAYLAAELPAPALVILEQLVRLGAGSAALQEMLARARLAAGDQTGAAEAYARAYALAPDDVDRDLGAAIGFGLAQRGDAQSRPPFATPDRSDPLSVLPGRTRSIEPSSDIVERPQITFADVGGMAAIKEEIRLRIIHPFTQPELYAAYGRKAGGGLLLYGPPGCGKTYLARATAGEIGASFVSVGIADVLEMWVGQSERNLRDIFETARAHRPAVLFFDEADALAADRSAFRGSAGRTVINQFLAELDGVAVSNDEILVLAATNAPWHLDPAFRRPGRFDQILFVPPPDLDARIEILRVLLAGKPTAGIDVRRVSEHTEGYSGADLKGIVDRAVERRLTEALRDGIPRPLTTSDVLDAAKAVTPTTREWFANVRNYVLYANESGLYDAVRPYVAGR